MDHAEAEVWPPYLSREDVEAMLAYSTMVAHWNSEALRDVQYIGSGVEWTAAIAFGITHEHHASFVYLVRIGHLGSAAALMRPAIEALIRGVWTATVGHSRVEHFAKGQDTKVPEKLLKEIIQSGRSDLEDLRASWEESKNSLHGFVHTSYQAVLRRADANAVPNEELIMSLRFMTGVALNATLELLNMVAPRIPISATEDERDRVDKLLGSTNTLLDRLQRSESEGIAALGMQRIPSVGAESNRWRKAW